jgi:predicted DsbA family dithiol-disulfide isomerase
MLHPEIPPEGRVRERRPGEPEGNDLAPHLAAQAEAEGLVMRRAALTPYSRPAQAVTEYAKQYGIDGRFHRLAYRAFWEDGANLGDLGVLARLAGEAGLDWSDIQPRLEAGEYDRTMQDQSDEGMRLGITGVPGFVVDDRFWFTGAQPIEMFRLAAKRALEAREPAESAGSSFGARIGEG